MKQLPNIITVLRIPLSAAMLFVPPFSAPFWALYLCSGFTDMIDGFLARKMNQESALGARLDSIADSFFAGTIAVFAVMNIALPRWLWRCVLGIALLRFVSYGIGFHKYRAFASLHTYANKMTGALIFIAPVLYSVCGMTFTGGMLVIAAGVSAVEELAITILSKELNHNRKSIFVR